MTRHDRELGEGKFLDPIISQQIESLRILIAILEATSSGKDFPIVPLLEALTDLGMAIAQSEIYFLSGKNPEIYEDPKGRSDALGNVRMITRYPKRWQLLAPTLASFGRRVATVAQKWKAVLETQSQWMDEEEQAILDPEDEKAASSRKSSRTYISKLKNHIFRDVRVQRSLEDRLKAEKEKRLKKEKVIQTLVHQLRKKKSDKT